jgi:hypothetical protein
MNESLNTTIMKMRLLREDAGQSADGVATNSSGAGQIDGIGVGPRGEPGGAAHRRRKRYALKSRTDRKLHKAPTGRVELDLMDLSDAGKRRFDEGNKETRGENELPEDENERFRRWKAGSEYRA